MNGSLFQFRPDDLTVEPWGQPSSVHTARTGVRITHKPTGVQAESAYYKSRLRNTDEALALLRHRLEATRG